MEHEHLTKWVNEVLGPKYREQEEEKEGRQQTIEEEEKQIIFNDKEEADSQIANTNDNLCRQYIDYS